ncbi:TIGR03905 family TSCPD domain-containing protein [Halonatronum saccharophilum]|uniref:TIGR03905 family TSCPD domain-containing protein n=1 Tax=Halonatronum saccharophilum TaxID=150060 RepID=UPI0004875D0F|nr:TIGR03905 family TSCPD domain-containing protein [Halonatronum saccharophilum]
MESFKTSGICAKEIKFDINDEGIIEKVEFIGGCNGNLAGIAALVEGNKVEDVANKLEGIACRNGTSCPDQLSKALKELI